MVGTAILHHSLASVGSLRRDGSHGAPTSHLKSFLCSHGTPILKISAQLVGSHAPWDRKCWADALVSSFTVGGVRATTCACLYSTPLNAAACDAL